MFWFIDVKNIDLQIKKHKQKTCFFTFIKNFIKNMHKNTKLQMFPIATVFRHYTRKEYFTQIIKNKNLPF